jgi:DNA-binding NarL/FixJ family response regulator
VTTIVLADDHTAVRGHVSALLEEEPDFCIIGEAADGLETTQTVERLRPDVLVLDLVMEGMNGIEVTRRVARSSPKTGVIIYSMYDNKEYVIEALQAGAKAYILKGSDSAELVHAIREVSAGHIYLPEPLLQYGTEAYRPMPENGDSGL